MKKAKRRLLVFSLFLILGTGTFIYFKIIAIPNHPVIFFNSRIDRELTDLATNLLQAVDDEWLSIDKRNRFWGIKSHREYWEKYGSVKVMENAKELIKKYKFSRIRIFNKPGKSYVAFCCYRKSTRTFYYYVYFSGGAPEVPIKSRKFSKKINDRWWFGTSLPS